MNSNNHYLLTLEWNAKNEMLEIHGTQQGLEKLRNKLNSLLDKSGPDHTHLMTKEWGGGELTNEKQNSENLMINHVKIFKWNDA